MLIVVFSSRVERFLDSVRPRYKAELEEAIYDVLAEGLVSDKGMRAGWSRYHRYRSGSFRIVYRVDGNKLRVRKISLRRDVYRTYMF